MFWGSLLSSPLLPSPPILSPSLSLPPLPLAPSLPHFHLYYLSHNLMVS